MGLDVHLEGENQCQTRPRPKIVHPPFRSRSKVEVRAIKGQPTSRYFHLKNLNGDFRELSLCNSTSPRRKSMPSRPHRVNVEDNVVQKRGSVYQSSSEVRRMGKLKEGRRKESAYNDETFLSFDIVDSSSWTRRDDDILFSQQRRLPLGSLNEPESLSIDTAHLIPTKSMELLDLSFRDLPEKQLNLSSSCSGCVLAKNDSAESLFEICRHPKDIECPRAKAAPDLTEKGSIEEPKSSFNKMLGLKNDGSTPYVRDIKHSLPKSFSAKVGVFNSPCQSEKEIPKTSPKIRFSPFKRMLDPIMKSKSLRNPSLVEAETNGSTATDPASISRNGSFCKSLLNDFSKTTHNIECDRQVIASDQISITGTSPAHLHAILKLDFKHGAPSFEFSVKDPEDVLYAKTWRTDSALNWAYTFHSCKRKNYSTGRGTKDKCGQLPSMVGQMQVSCFLCSEVSENGSLDNYMVTEFVLYDIAQARRSFAFEERSHCPSDSIQPPMVTVSDDFVTDSSLESNSSTDKEKYQHLVRRTLTDCDADHSNSYPCSPADLHPYLEIAAIVIQIPFKKENLKDMQMEEMASKDRPNLSSVSSFHNGKDTNSNCLNPAVVKVVIPSGPHGLPNTEEGDPSPLLDRWRFGGGCDCGGWDMACPIVVFDNPCGGDLVDYSITGSQQPMLLFFQGRKDKVPALSIMADGKGQYSVDFHAQLSALQAFSICIAILHSSEASSAGRQEKSRHRLYSNSLRLLLEEEVKHLIEAVAEEKRKAKKKIEHIPPSFCLDPPFSPIGRV